MTWEELDAIRARLRHPKQDWAAALGVTGGTYTNWRSRKGWRARGSIMMLANIYNLGMVTLSNLTDKKLL